LQPGQVWILRLDFLRHTLGCFADDLKQAGQRQVEQPVLIQVAASFPLGDDYGFLGVDENLA